MYWGGKKRVQGNRVKEKPQESIKNAERAHFSVCAQMCTAWDTSRGNKISTCGHTTTRLLEQLRCGGMAHATRVLRWTDTHFRKDKQERQAGGVLSL